MKEDPTKEWLKQLHKAKKRKLLGDKIEEILEPIVEKLDETLGTKFKGCKPCQKRKELLNQLDVKITGSDEEA